MGRLRGLFWARPLAPADVAAAAARIAEHDEEKALLGSAVKSTDGFFTTFLVSPYSSTSRAGRRGAGWTPNLVTCLSMLVGVLAAAAFATGERWGLVLGAVLLQAAFTLDCVDGQLARYTRTFTPLGAWLDSIFDRGKEYVVYAGLAIGAGEDVWLLAAAALALQTTRHAGDFAFNAARDEAIRARLAVPQFKRDKRRPAARAVRARRARSSGLRKVFVLPIGERFALISLTAALFDARVTFLALLAWGGAGARLHDLRPALALARRARARRRHRRRRQRRRAAAGLPRRRRRGAAARPRRRAAAPGAAGRARCSPAGCRCSSPARSRARTRPGGCRRVRRLGGRSAAGSRARRVLRDRLRWAVPQLLRAIEYGAIIWIAAVAGHDAEPGRVRAAGRDRLPPLRRRLPLRPARRRRRRAALGLLLGGWDGRLLLATALGAAGAAAAGFFVLAAVDRRRSPSARRSRSGCAATETSLDFGDGGD